MPDTNQDNPAQAIVIRRWQDLADRQRLGPALDRVFFDSSATRTFAGDDARAAFRERWLGRYLRHYPQWAFIAMERDERLVGYVIGSTDDPAQSPLFADIAYFRDFSGVTPHYPAQLHVNLDPEWRGLGIGSRLIQTCMAELAMAGVPGVHIVTTRGMRNVGYYLANGFEEVASTHWNGRELVMLGRRLQAPGAS